MIEQFVSQETCLECKGCCRFTQQGSVWSPCLLDGDIEELTQNNIPPAVISGAKTILLIPYPEDNIYVCPFLNFHDNKCKIYSFRPFECQLYPFLINRKMDKVFLAVDLKCPFVKQGLKSKEYKKYVRYLTGLLNSPGWKKTLRNNSQIFQAYPEALNLAELKL